MFNMASRPPGLAGLHTPSMHEGMREPRLQARGPGSRGGVEVKFDTGGVVPGAAPGRADTVNATVPSGTYIIPADVVSGLGQGNTNAGVQALQAIFSKLPKSPAPTKDAKVRLSSGEFAVTPDMLMQLGSAQLDGLVQGIRQKSQQAVAQMPPPR